MKIDFAQPLMDVEGKPITRTAGDDEAATLLFVCGIALKQEHPDERIGTDEKLKRYQLLKKIHEPLPDLKAEEIALLKRLIGIMSIEVVGAACDLLDPPAKAEG